MYHFFARRATVGGRSPKVPLAHAAACRKFCNAMAFIPVPDVALCRVSGRIDGQLTINTLYFEISGGGITPVNLADLAAAVDSWASGSLAPLLSEDWTYERTDAIDLTTQTGFVSTFASPVVGGVEGEAAPNNVACCISIRTGNAGRSFRGRNFVPGIPNSVITLNTLDAGFRTGLLSAYGELVGAGTFLAGWQFGVVSRYTAGAPRATGVISPVTGLTIVGQWVRSMRSREVGHGA